MPIWYGGDYNPEQWPREVWDEDVTLMRQAGVNLATVAVFAWSRLEPRDGEFDFEWLDVVLGKLHAEGVRVDLATATASPPAWLAAKHPEMLPVTASGVRLSVGSRQHYCPSSPVYRHYATRLAGELAARYGDHPALEMWHVNNEYGAHVSHCYCDVSAAAFRSWLSEKYGTVETLNEAWGTAFWSQRYSTFEEIEPPRDAPTFKNPCQQLDFDRFSSDELLACYRAEAAVLRAATPGIPVTTNFMGLFKPANYWAWATELDLIADDSYPDPGDELAPLQSAMTRDLMRSLAGDKPWVLMEQAAGAVNWRAINAAKEPGQMRAWSYQAIARGARGILFFQWRQSVAGAEQFHSGMLPHGGTDTRVWREVAALGTELEHLSPQLGSPGGSNTDEVAIILDWDSWWALDQDARPTRIDYAAQLFAWYRTCAEAGLRVRFVQAGADLSGFPAVVAPCLFALSDNQINTLSTYAETGGRLLITFQSAIVDQNLRVRAGGYLGALQQTLGLWIEEFMPLSRPTTLTGDSQATATSWAEVIRVVDAKVEAEFADGPAAGYPAITSRQAGKGSAWYVAGDLDDAGRTMLLRQVVPFEMPQLPAGVEQITDGGLTFIINNSPAPHVLDLTGTDLLSGNPALGLELPRHGVAAVQPTRSNDA